MTHYDEGVKQVGLRTKARRLGVSKKQKRAGQETGARVLAPTDPDEACAVPAAPAVDDFRVCPKCGAGGTFQTPTPVGIQDVDPKDLDKYGEAGKRFLKNRVETSHASEEDRNVRYRYMRCRACAHTWLARVRSVVF